MIGRYSIHIVFFCFFRFFFCFFSFQFRPGSASAGSGGGHEGYAHIHHGGSGIPIQPQSHHRSGVRYSSQPQLNRNAILDFGEVTSDANSGLRPMPNTSKEPRYKTCSCPFVRYFRTLFLDDITII